MSEDQDKAKNDLALTLRDRIAAVLYGYVDPSHRYDLADAVIAELQLKQLILDTDDAIGKRRFRCLATPWELIAQEGKADDE